MPKKILYESAIHQLLWAGKRLQARTRSTSIAQAETLARWIAALEFVNPGPGAVLVSWTAPIAGSHTIALKSARFYTRGDPASQGFGLRDRR